MNSKYIYDGSIILYTYWFTSLTSAFALLNDGQKVITRVHGADLYEERNNNYIPLRKQTLKKVTNVFCVSVAGVNYLTSRYPQFSSKYKLARIGVKTTNVNINFTKRNKNMFRIVSCSSLIPLKRVDLILRGVYEFAKNNLECIIEYVHFGSGPLMDEIVELARENLCKNLTVSFKGNIPNDKLLEFYKNNFIDVFITASSTEGGCPVTLQEAQSFGIPSLGTSVGGIPEVINDESGILISSNPTPTEISQALTKFYNMNDEKNTEFRKNSYTNWQKYFNADINFKNFASEISLL